MNQCFGQISEKCTEIPNTVYSYLVQTMLSLSGRVNFSNMSCYSHLNEKTYSQNFRRYIDVIHYNSLLIEHDYNPGHEYILVIDASFITKNVKATHVPVKFWNGMQSRSMKGLEILRLPW